MMKRLLGTAGVVILLAATPATAQDNASARMPGLKLSSDQPIQIESDKLEVRDAEGMAIFTGNVQVVQGETLMRSGRMMVYYAKSADEGGSATPAVAGTPDAANIERIEVDNKVYVKTQTQVATSDTASFDMIQEVLVMTGKEVVLSDNGNVIVGCKLTVQMASGQAVLDGCGTKEGKPGRVKMLLQPKSQTQ